MAMSYAATGRSRLLWMVLLMVWCALVGVWSPRLLTDSASDLSDFGSLALAIGSAFLALTHLDRNVRRQRIWLIVGSVLIGVSLVLLWKLVSRY
jgi:hypothetical protein